MSRRGAGSNPNNIVERTGPERPALTMTVRPHEGEKLTLAIHMRA